jgi:D-amino-acid dehydrogenase
MHVAVIGAGITGLTTCRALLLQGHEVSLFDRAPHVASQASKQNGAQLSYAYVAPLSAPSLLTKIPALMLAAGAPLSIRVSLNYNFFRWSLQFLRSCTQTALEGGTAALLELAELSRRSADSWLCAIDPATIHHRRNGKLVLFSDKNSLSNAEKQLQLQSKLGSLQQLLSADECVETEPAVTAYRSHIVGGILTRTDEVADCKKVCDALIAELLKMPGLVYYPSSEVKLMGANDGDIAGIAATRNSETLTYKMDAYVVSAGVATPHLLEAVGVHIAILPLKGYSVDIPRQSLKRFPELSITDTASKTVFAPLGQGQDAVLRVAGFAELNARNDQADSSKIAVLENSATRLFEASGDQVISNHPWGGLRPVTPDSRPFIGRTRKWRNLYVNAGQGALGFTLAFGSAQLIADIISDRTTSISRSLFARDPLVII